MWRTPILAIATITSACGSGRPAAPPPAGNSCIGGKLLADVGRSRMLVGAAMGDATAAAAAWDVRYLYLAGGLFDSAAPCASCATSCTAAGHSCANSAGGCAWWGCYQYDQISPGEYVRDFVAAAKGRGEIPWFTYYELLQASGLAEGRTEVAALDDAAFLTRYLADFRFLLQQLGNETAFVHVEPDFWAYAQMVNPDPHRIPARVQQAAPADCGSLEDSAAGFVQCLIAMARKHAPHALVGLHASSFATGRDVSLNTDPSLDVPAEARKVAAFLSAAGAGQADFVATDASDRDAGYYRSIGRNTFWDPANATLPDFAQAFTWVKAVAEGLQLPAVYWQVPVGNESLANRPEHWKDNRVDTFFLHTDELVAAHVVATLFGAGAAGMTTPETDGGNLVAKAKGYLAAGGQVVCR